MSETQAKDADYMDPEFHREMVELGWRLPQAEGEVRAAEAFVAEQPGELPTRLRDDVELSVGDGAARPDGLLARYLRDAGADSGPKARGREGQRGKDMDRS